MSRRRSRWSSTTRLDFNHTAEWNVNVIEMTRGAPLARFGDTFSGTLKVLGQVYTGKGVVTQFERPRVIAFTSASPDGGQQDWTSHFTPAGTGTDIDTVVDYEIPMRLLGAIADKLFIERTVQRNLEQSRDNFVAMLEHSVPTPV